MPKKAGAYYLYMLHFKRKEEERTGNTLSLPEISQMASQSWNAMTDDQKAYYKEKAKGGDYKIPGRAPMGNRQEIFTSQGIPLSQIEREERLKKEAEEKMRRRIDHMIQTIPLMTDFLSHPLYFMYGNYFYKNRSGVYAPAELALAKFTFQNGFIKRYHTFINPGTPEIGYAFEVKEHSEQTHRIPAPGPHAFDGETNLDRVFYEIQKFFKDEGETFDRGPQMVFTFTDPYANEANQIEVLTSFMDQMRNGKNTGIVFFPMTRLFYALRKELAQRGKCEDIPNENFASIFLSRDPYETNSGISCLYHEQKDATRYCALSRVRRWTFIMADFFCEPLGVNLVAGKHLPKNASISSSTVSDTEVKVGEEQNTINTGFMVSKHRDIRASHSTFSFDVQSVITASSAPSRAKNRKSRAEKLISSDTGSTAPSNLPNAPSSNVQTSTFYNN